MQDVYHLEADLPSKDVKIKQLESNIEELESELEMRSREIDRLKKINRYIYQKESKASNEEDSEMSMKQLKFFVHDDDDDALRSRNEDIAVITNLKEMKDSKEREPLILPKPLWDVRNIYAHTVCVTHVCI